MLTSQRTFARGLSALFFATVLISNPNAWAQIAPFHPGSATSAAAKANSNENNVSYRLVVEFGSLCCGPDGNAMRQLSEVVAKYEKQIAKPIVSKIVHPGLEGETTFCFQLSELSSETQVDFVSEIRTVSRTGRVKIEENAPCSGDA